MPSTTITPSLEPRAFIRSMTKEPSLNPNPLPPSFIKAASGQSGRLVSSGQRLPRINATNNLQTDLVAFVDYLVTRPELQIDPTQFDSARFLKETASKLVNDAYKIYRQSVGPSQAPMTRGQQRELLTGMLGTIPAGTSLSIQGLQGPFTTRQISAVMRNDAQAIQIKRSDDKEHKRLANNHQGRLSIKLNPQNILPALNLLGLITRDLPHGVSHAKMMNPRILGKSPEDAVIYLTDLSVIPAILDRFSAQPDLTRSDTTGVLFMREIDKGVFEGLLPQEAFAFEATRPNGIFSTDCGRGSLGYYYALVAVAAALEAKATGASTQDAIQTVMNAAH